MPQRKSSRQAARPGLYQIRATTRRGMAAAPRTAARGNQLAHPGRAGGLASMGFSCLERLAGTYLVPCPSPTMPSWPAVDQMARGGLTALAPPPGFLPLDKVATVVPERYAPGFWIRPPAADAHPGAILVTVLRAAAPPD